MAENISDTGDSSTSLSKEENEQPSDQVAHLDSVAFSRYLQKLSLSGYQLPDPYSLPTKEWADRVCEWPPVEYGNIFSYFISTPGMYTPETLQSYKSLDSYSLYYAGHVQTVLYHSVSPQSPVCILRARVLKSQSVQDKPYDTWASTYKKDGRVSAAHCTCMAG